MVGYQERTGAGTGSVGVVLAREPLGTSLDAAVDWAVVFCSLAPTHLKWLRKEVFFD